MAKKKKGRSVKRNPQTASIEPESLTRAPHSFVITRGQVGRYVRSLMKDFRKIMEPFTASSLVVRKNNTIKDFVSVAGVLHVSHLVMFTCTEISPYMRVLKLPHGPTLTFKVHDYVLARDVVSSLKKQMPHNKYFNDPPLVILNGFSCEGAHLKLISTMFQGMFPTINITKVNLNTVRRCLLLSYNSDTKCIDLRHYGIRVTPVGLSRGVKKLVKGKVPDLSRFKEISDFLTQGDCLSESEAEDDPNSQVTLPQKISSRGNMLANKSSIKLTEIGPRLTLQLVKVEGGLLDGEVMYHEYIKKTKEEIAIIQNKREEKRKLKEKRKREQELNVKAKQAKNEELRQNSLEGIRKKREQTMLENDKLMKKAALESLGDKGEEEDDDAEWFKQEVGIEPEPELFQKKGADNFKRKRDMLRFKPRKKHKNEDSKNVHENKNSLNFKQTKNYRKDRSSQGKMSSTKRGQPFNTNQGRRGSKRKILGTKVKFGKRH